MTSGERALEPVDVTANFIDRADRNLGTITFDAARDARVEINGRRTRFSSLRPGADAA